jgi:hypothetical protein
MPLALLLLAAIEFLVFSLQYSLYRLRNLMQFGAGRVVIWWTDAAR